MCRVPGVRVHLAALALALIASRSSAADSALGLHRASPILRPERAAPAAAGVRLVYFGGRVLSNVELVKVLWGDGRYEPYVAGDGTPSLDAFLGAVAGSAFVTGLAEYDTTAAAFGGVPGTNQHIGAGTFLGAVRIVPSVSGGTVDDVDIAAELAEQLAKGGLPPPRADAAGNLETLYLVYLPAGKTVTLGTEQSCRTFCAYHGAFTWQGRRVPYAVLPDLSRGSGCDAGCGGAEPFANAAAVVTHELAEAITDPDVSAAGTGAGPPLAWYDPLNGEIGDLCAGERGMVTGTDGASWPVQKVWSNARGGCVVPAAPAGAPLVAAAVPAPLPVAPAEARPIAAAELAPPAPRRAALLAFQPPVSAAQPAAVRIPALPAEPSPLPLGRRVRVELAEENDALGTSRHPTDELYTQGFRVAVRWSLRGDQDDGAGPEVGVAVGQNIYTPSDLRTTDLAELRHDRPYAGWLYAAFLFRMVGDGRWSLRLGADAAGSGERITEFEVAAGVTGPESGGAEVQTRFHALLREWSGSPTSPPAPVGWSVYQVASQPTVDTSFRHQLDLVQASGALGAFSDRTGALLGVRLSPRVRLDAGSTLDAVGAGVEARVGFVPSARVRRPRWPFALYGFARADGRYVLRNAFIEGPLRYGVTPLVAVQPWVGDLDVGAVLRLGNLEVGYGQLWRTSELAPNPPGERRVHEVGQLTIAWAAP
jgi:hypothetical protein